MLCKFNLRMSADVGGVAAVEFALIAPLLIYIIFAVVCFGTIISTYVGVQQLAAESARASIAGLNDTERNQLASAYLANNLAAYPFLDATKLTMTSGTTGADARSDGGDPKGRLLRRPPTPTATIAGRISRFRHDHDGSTAVLTAIAIFALVGTAALAVDSGTFYYDRRRLQSATDLAALAAAADLTNAAAAAGATLTRNGFAAASLAAVDLGTYTADPTVAPTNRFVTPPTSTPNAVRLTVQTTAPIMLGRIFNFVAGAPPQSGADMVTIATKAVAAQENFASFAIGSSLATLNSGVLNAVLGGLLGSNLSLSVMDYQNLVAANLDLFAFSNALATRVGVTGISFNQLAGMTFRQSDVLNAVTDTARANSGVSSAAVSALAEIAAAAGGGTMSLASLLSFGPYANATVGTTPIAASLSALTLVSAVAQIANGTHQVQTAVALGIPGIASASLQLAIGERPVGTSFVEVGAQGSTVHTAQTRLLLTVQLAAVGQPSLVSVPIYIELAAGTAQLAAIQCTPGDLTTSSVTLSVTPAIVDAWIGSVSNANFVNLGTPLAPGPATLFAIPILVSVSGLAHATMTNLSPTAVTFSYQDIEQATAKTTSTTDFVASLLSNLLGSLQINVNVVGLGLGLPSGLGSLVSGTIGGAATPIDQALNSVLGALGINLGQATTWVGGITCGNGALVQ